MVKRYSGGFITASTLVTTNESASGFFDNAEVMQRMQAGTWPTPPAANEMFVPAGTTQLLGLKFNTGTLTRTGTYTVTATGTLSYQTTGGIQNTGYATNWTFGSVYLTVDNLSSPAVMLNKTYVAWYKGTQTASGGSYSPSVPIFGDPTGAVYWGLGLSSGNICIANGVLNKGTTTVNTGEWFCLAWTINGSGSVSAYVNGSFEVSASITTGYGGTQYIGSGYAYNGTEAPTALDAVQIFDGILTPTQLGQIYELGVL
jgi:hypothetical protein